MRTKFLRLWDFIILLSAVVSLMIYIFKSDLSQKSHFSATTLPISNKIKDTIGNSVIKPDTTLIQLDTPIFIKEIFLYPSKINEAELIKILKEKAKLEIGGFPTEPDFKEKIVAYKEIKISGVNESLILIEYSYGCGVMVAYPWKYQLIFSKQGKLIATLFAESYRLIKVFPDKSRYLLTITSTARGNGSHQLYKFKQDSLVNILQDTLLCPKTYDVLACESTANKPEELILKITDTNQDGWNDLVFSGELLYDPLNMCVDESKNVKKKSIKIFFLYDFKRDLFYPKEDYNRKYCQDIYDL